MVVVQIDQPRDDELASHAAQELLSLGAAGAGGHRSDRVRNGGGQE
jgi:hypothetical protein